jgi:arabinan endo-1,5-alpha-L-arabinosidase
MTNVKFFSRTGRVEVFCLLALLSHGGAAYSFASTRDLTGAVISHDPTIIKEDATWWIFETGQGLPVKHSANGTHWNQGVRLLNTEKSWWRTWAPNMGSLDVWAPDIHRFGNRTWCYYSVSEFGKNNSAIGLVSCTSIAAGDWRDDGFVIGSKSGTDAFNAIDPNLTTDVAGNPWLAFGSWFSGIQIVQLDPATMKPVGSVQTLAKRNGGIEAPAIVHANGYYYLFMSFDTCCQGVNSTYKIAYGRSSSITGPYFDKDGVALLNGGGTILESGGTRWKGPGGQDVHQTDTGWLLVRHSYDANNNGAPTLRLSDLYFDENYWPTFTEPVQPPPPPGPVITAEPVSRTIAPGGSVTFNVTATGNNLSYQWRKNGQAIPGATSSSLTLTGVQPTDAAQYTVVVSSGAASTTSATAHLIVDTPKVGRLINLSVRSRAGVGDQTLIAGFVVSGSGTKPVMVRGTGPTLSAFNVSGVLADPKLILYQGSTSVAENDSWGTAANQQGIIALNGHRLGSVDLHSKDAVLLLPVDATAYTAHIRGSDGGSGIALAEVYDADLGEPGTPGFDQQARLVNISARTHVGTGDSILIAGFVINGNVPRRVMVRGTGPTLANFGVSGVLPDPMLQLYSGSAVIAQNDNWTAAPNVAEIQAVGGHKLGAETRDSRDATLVLTLLPGAYTAHVSGVNNTTGIGLVEVYDLE